MSSRSSRFGALARAVSDRVAEPPDTVRSTEPLAAVGAGVHRPSAALAAATEGLVQRVARLEGELAASQGDREALEAALATARQATVRAGTDVEEFAFLDPASVADPLPRDRMAGAFAGPEFEQLLADIRDHGQNDAITVRAAADGYEIAAGRRRLEVCRRLGREVLARVRPLDDASMLRVQFAENERRQDISALERGRWFAEVKARFGLQSKDLAARFDLDKSTLSLYLRLARFPDEIGSRLVDPRRLSVLRARRVMEALEADPSRAARVVQDLEAYAASWDGTPDPDDQVLALMRSVDRRADVQSGDGEDTSHRRHIVHRGRRVGTLTKNGGQWIFRFATDMRADVVQQLADRLGDLVAEIETERRRVASAAAADIGAPG